MTAAMQILQELVEIDTDLLLAINGRHSPFWDSFMNDFSGKLIWVPMYAAILYVVWKNFSWKVAILSVVAVALTITFADQVCSSLIRPAVERLRPSNLASPIADLVHIVDGHRGGRYGFPSCHAANTWGLALFLHLLLRNKWLSLYMAAWALVTCYSRAYLGLHYPGDLLVGALVGMVGAVLMFGLLAAFGGYKRPRTVKCHTYPIVVGGLLVAGMMVAAAISL